MRIPCVRAMTSSSGGGTVSAHSRRPAASALSSAMGRSWSGWGGSLGGLTSSVDRSSWRCTLYARGKAICISRPKRAARSTESPGKGACGGGCDSQVA
eukprot:7389484-Prymnesium_polylepis.1